MEKILDSIKKVLMIDPEYKAFDADIVMHINSTFATLNQLGVGPVEGFELNESNLNDATWEMFLGTDHVLLNNVKSFVFLSVRLLFDNATMTSYAIQAMERQLEQMAWRINARREEVAHPWVDPLG